jgi:hypothetical protein
MGDPRCCLRKARDRRSGRRQARQICRNEDRALREVAPYSPAMGASSGGRSVLVGWGGSGYSDWSRGAQSSLSRGDGGRTTGEVRLPAEGEATDG